MPSTPQPRPPNWFWPQQNSWWMPSMPQVKSWLAASCTKPTRASRVIGLDATSRLVLSPS
ncbi:hypothetical protein WMF39_30270 [Sorangium sp. So ce1504]|uniref:hypothetical protein n=1 Tax=Sorangium sp. So ce1504 TaxID=3133337 RepID=UPI003F61C602